MGTRGWKMNLHDAPDPGAVVAHTASISAIFAAFVGWIPIIVALIPAIYYLILIYESSTVQTWVHKRALRRTTRRVAKLKAKQRILAAQIIAEEKAKED